MFLYPLRLGLNGLAVAYVASSILAGLMAFFFSRKFVPFFDRKIKPVFAVKNLLRFSIPMSLSTLFFTLNRQVDTLILALFVTASDIAVYVVAVRLLTPVELIVHAFGPIFQPFVSELYSKKEIARISVILKIITKWVLITSLPLVVYISFFPHFFVQFFGSQFLKGQLCLQILAAATLLRSLTSLTGTVIYMSGRSDITFKNNVALLSASVILNYILVQHYGILGAAVATAASMICLSALRLVEVYHLMGIHPFRRDLWKPILASLISLALLALARHYTAPVSNLFEAILFTTFILCHAFLMSTFRFSEEDAYLRHLARQRLLSLIR